MSYGVGHKHGSDPMLLLLLLWCRSAAVALIQPLAWESPYATGVALNKQTNKQKHKDPGINEMRRVGSKPHLQPTPQLIAMLDP